MTRRFRSPRCSVAFAFIEKTIAQTSVAPSLQEISVALGFSGRSAAHATVEDLIADGHLRRTGAYAVRALEICDPDVERRMVDRIVQGLVEEFGDLMASAHVRRVVARVVAER